ncbi:MAG TPA: ATP-dependent Clp protease proteolytic subunit [Gemmatales bacterium]|nr:ATP-dependent Clp protease proteolytic subunit [Gemmatales bacterium]
MSKRLDTSCPAYVNFSANISRDPVDDLMVLMADLHRQGFKEAHLLISSPGGGVIRGIELHNFLRGLPIQLSTYNTATVDSIANIVYLAGDKRYVNQNANFLMHGVSWEFRGAVGEQQLEEALAAVRRDQRVIADTIAGRTKLQRDHIERMFRGDNILTPADAVTMGISHEIKDVEIPEKAHVFVITNPAPNR